MAKSNQPKSDKSLKGQLLLASSRLIDPNFARSVILMVQHDENGALGLILNRPLQTTVKEVCDEALELPCAVEANLFQGGPCEGPLMVVHRQESSGQIQVLDDVFFTTDRAQIESLLLNGEASLKFFVGYAGWSPGQLESEIETGSWVTTAGDADQIFNADGAQDQWTRLMTRATLGAWIDPKRIPDDPNLN
jgi:putative transcriptional regulator